MWVMLKDDNTVGREQASLFEWRPNEDSPGNKDRFGLISKGTFTVGGMQFRFCAGNGTSGFLGLNTLTLDYNTWYHLLLRTSPASISYTNF